MESFKVVVLGVKHMNHFILKQCETPEAILHMDLEKSMQTFYGNRNFVGGNAKNKTKLKVGSYVAANVELGKSKLWLRGIIRENYHQKDFLYGVHFGDYGLDKTLHKSELKELVTTYCPNQSIPFQEFNFYLTDVDHKPGVNREEVLEEIITQFESKNFVVLVTVEGRDKKGCIYGSIEIEKDCDLAAILLVKQLVCDNHNCGRHYSNFTQNDYEKYERMEDRTALHLPGPFRSGFKLSRNTNNSVDLICKCDAVLKYSRKILRKELKIKESKESSDGHLFYKTI